MVFARQAAIEKKGKYFKAYFNGRSVESTASAIKEWIKKIFEKRGSSFPHDVQYRKKDRVLMMAQRWAWAAHLTQLPRHDF